MRVALRVEVNSLRGLREGIPNIMRLFHEYQVRATFFFPLGFADEGLSPHYVWRHRRTRGWGPLLQGALKPAGSFVDEATEQIVRARENGHEVGVFGLSPRVWARLGYLGEDRVARECETLWESVSSLYGDDDVPLATPEWQSSPALIADLRRRRCAYSSTTRGRFPFLPLLQGQDNQVVEIPTTLPTADELLASEGVNEDNVHEFLFADSRRLLPAGHVYAASAEREGLDLYPLLEKMLVMWRGQSGSIGALGDMLKEMDAASVPTHRVGWDTPAGATRAMAAQSLPVSR